MGPRHPFPRVGSLGPLVPAAIVLLLAAPPAAGNSTQILISHGLISQDVGDGGDLFFSGTFGGNGRTCGSCHPVDTLLSLSNAEALDAVDVLQGQALHGSAVTLIQDGIALNEQAINTNSSSTRKQLMQDALAKAQQAKAELGTGLSFTLGQGNLMF